MKIGVKRKAAYMSSDQEPRSQDGVTRVQDSLVSRSVKMRVRTFGVGWLRHIPWIPSVFGSIRGSWQAGEEVFGPAGS